MFWRRKQIDSIALILLGIATLLFFGVIASVFFALQSRSDVVEEQFYEVTAALRQIDATPVSVTEEYVEELEALQEEVKDADDVVNVAAAALLQMRVPAALTDHHLDVFVEVQGLAESTALVSTLRETIISAIDRLLDIAE